jgi:PAS domain S-box-containing protein
MKDREVSTIQVFPVIQDHTAGGCLVLWGGSLSLSQSVTRLLLVITGVLGEAQLRVKTETEIARIIEKFKGVMEDIGDMYYLTDKAGILLEVSPSMATALEYPSSSDLIGMNMETLLLQPEVWPLFLSEVLHKNGVKDYELVMKGNRGKIFTGSVSCRLIFDEEGYLQGSEGVIRDISRRRQYEQLVQESEWKLEQAQKIAKLGVWSFDTVSQAFRVSPEIFSLLNFPADKSLITLDDIIGKCASGDKVKFSQYFTQMVKGGNEFGFEFMIDLPDEKFKYIRIKGQPRIRGGAVTGSFGILQDITERKEVEQHLLKYANQLEQKTLELDAMRTQLLDMNRELDQRVRRRTTQIEELLRQKDEFIIQIGHDLKTPLTPLVAILPVIRKRITDPEIGELLDISIGDVQSIKKMIETILKLARMNALYTVSDLQEINLHDALDQIISDNAYLIHQKSLNIRNLISGELSIKISPMHLETLMTNLIGNAVKYSYIEGEIIVSGYEKMDSIVVEIRDFGIGIEPDVLPRIFDSFYKADSSRHDRESHGLGLAIAQRVADIYGGVIRVESEGSGKGSTFSVHLKKNPRIKSPLEIKNEKT